MKEKMKKKSGIFAALTVALLLVAALITSCPEPFEAGDFTVENDNVANGNGFTPSSPPPAGMSYIRLDLGLEGDGNGRTVMPSIWNDSFDHFEISIYETNDPTIQIPVAPSYTHTELTLATFLIKQEVGYTIVVNAKDSSNATVATGTVTHTATSADSLSTQVYLNLTAALSGTGAIDLRFSYPNDFSTLDIAICEINDLTGNPIISKDLTTATGNFFSQNETIAAGYYYGVVTLEKAGYVPIIYTDVIHIYGGGLTTDFSKWFDNLLTSLPTYTVTFYNFEGDGNSTSNPVTYNHGSFLNDATHYPYTGGPAHTDGASSFAGWYTESVSGSVVNINNTQVLGNLSLYARWVANSNLSLNLKFEDVGSTLSLTGGTPTLYRSTFSTTGTTLTPNFGAISPSAVEWIIGGYTFTGNTLTVKYDPSTPTLNTQLGGSSIQITLIVTKDSIPYSKVFTFNIAANP